MFSGILTVRNDEEWMRTQKATLTLEEVIEAIGDAFKDTYSPRAPAELTYIVVIGGGSKLEVEASDESVSEFIDSCQYVAISPHNPRAEIRGKRGLISRASHGLR